AAPGASVRVGYEVRNGGDEVLTIENTSKSCGCTITSASEPIAPGAAGDIVVTFKLSSPGAKTVSVQFKTNDPSTPSLSLKIQCRAVAEVYANPASLDTADMVLRKEREIAIEICAPESCAPFRVLDVRAPAAWMSLRDAPAFPSEPARRHSFLVRILPNTQGSVRECISIRTNSPAVPLLEVPLRGEIAGPYTLSPKTFSFGVVPPGKNVTRKLAVSRSDGQSFTVASPPSGPFACVPSPRGESVTTGDCVYARVWAVEVSAASPKKKGLWKDRLNLSLTTESGDKLLLGVKSVGVVWQKPAAHPAPSQ
ncbi:MAG: DUF1573 domain-containing protein, partial [bacterium]|nr:DUF1573 domain-containing protein [bacterium]